MIGHLLVWIGVLMIGRITYMLLLTNKTFKKVLKEVTVYILIFICLYVLVMNMTFKATFSDQIKEADWVSVVYYHDETQEGLSYTNSDIEELYSYFEELDYKTVMPNYLVPFTYSSDFIHLLYKVEKETYAITYGSNQMIQVKSLDNKFVKKNYKS